MKLFGKGKSDDFTDLLNKGITSYRMGQLDRAVDLLGQAIRIRPDDPEAVYMRGMANARMGNLLAAIQDFECMYVMPTPSRLNKRDACYNLGKAYDELQKWDDSIKWYNRVTELDPDYVNVYANRGGVHLKLGDAKADLHEFDLAVADLTTALTLTPGDALAYFNRAIANIRMQNIETVPEDLAKFLEFAPANHPYRKEVEKMLAEADKPTSTKLGMMRERQLKDLLQRITVSNDEKQYQETIPLCDKYLEESRTEPAVWDEKAFALWGLGHQREALTVCLEGIDHNPQTARLYHTKGGLLAELGQYREAIGAYEKYLAVAPSEYAEQFPWVLERIEMLKRKLIE